MVEPWVVKSVQVVKIPAEAQVAKDAVRKLEDEQSSEMPMGMPHVCRTRVGPKVMKVEDRSASRTSIAMSVAANLWVMTPSRALVWYGRVVPESKVTEW